MFDINDGTNEYWDINHSHKTSEKITPRLRKIYYDMNSRCNDTSNASYPLYGAIGIEVCSDWSDSIVEFQTWAYSNGYTPTMTIDRIDNELGYSPDNCRWLSKSDQNRNKKKTSSTGEHNIYSVSGNYLVKIEQDNKKITKTFDNISDAIYFRDKKFKELNIKEL